MSLNKFSDEDNGYNLKLNVGADTVKCNNLEVINEPWVEYEQQNPPRNKPTAEGRLAIYKTDNVNGTPITSSNVIRVVPTDDVGGVGESLELGSSQMRTNNRVDASVFMPQMPVSNITVGTTNSNLSAQYDINAGILAVSTNEATTETNCNSIRLLPEYKDQANRTWCYRFMCRGTRLSLASGYVASSNFYPLITPSSPAPYVITPSSGLAIVECYWLPTEEAFYCIQTT